MNIDTSKLCSRPLDTPTSCGLDYKREYERLQIQATKDRETIDNLKQAIKLLSKASTLTSYYRHLNIL